MQAFDDFDFGSAESITAHGGCRWSNAIVEAACSSNRIHIMQSFQHPETDLVVCDR